MRIAPINPDQSPLVILDLMTKLKIRDVMTTALITASRQDSLRRIQQLMKQNRITGVPIAENGRLFGIISIDNIIDALENNRMDEPAERHMSTNVVVLEDDMPLSMGISCFSRYRFGRFPVLNREKQLVGIITSRNVNVSLLMELVKEVQRLESEKAAPAPAEALHMVKMFRTLQFDFENAGKASAEIKKILQQGHADPKIIRRTAVASYELEINQIIHAVGGTITCLITPERIELTAQDSGPGIPDVAAALQEGFTTANEWVKSMGFGAGMGLPNVQRVADEFHIHSEMGRGTTVTAIIFLDERRPAVPPEDVRELITV